MFFGKDFDGAEVRCEAGPLQLAGLFCGIAFRDQDESMPGGECGKRLSHTRKQLDLVLVDGAGEFEDTAMLLVGEGRA